MIVKRFTAKTAEEALAQAKWELGDEAIILSSGKARDAWWKFWQHGFQVLVATDYRRRPERVAPVPEAEEARVAPIAPPLAAPPDSRMDDVLGLLKGLDQRLDRLEAPQESAPDEIRQWLLKRGVSMSCAEQIAEASHLYQAKEPRATVVQAVRASLLERLSPPAPISLKDPATVLFIGPTGSGKTTTVAKLAAYCRLEQKKSVLLISTDTFRVAAIEQLKTYSEILGVPFKVALRPQEIPDILSSHAWDVVLIDTAGHSLYHSLYMSEIRTIAELSRATEIELVLPATMDAEVMRQTALKFGEGLNPKLCVTKVDEVPYPGAALSAALDLGWPLSYVTDGQNVPDDIQVAFPETLVNLLEGEA